MSLSKDEVGEPAATIEPKSRAYVDLSKKSGLQDTYSEYDSKESRSVEGSKSERVIDEATVEASSSHLLSNQLAKQREKRDRNSMNVTTTSDYLDKAKQNGSTMRLQEDENLNTTNLSSQNFTKKSLLGASLLQKANFFSNRSGRCIATPAIPETQRSLAISEKTQESQVKSTGRIPSENYYLKNVYYPVNHA